MKYYISIGALGEIVSECKVAAKKLKKHQIKSLLLKLGAKKRITETVKNFKTLENGKNNGKNENENDVERNDEKDDRKEVVEEVENEEALMLDAIGMFSVLQYALLGVLRVGVKGGKDQNPIRGPDSLESDRGIGNDSDNNNSDSNNNDDNNNDNNNNNNNNGTTADTKQTHAHVNVHKPALCTYCLCPVRDNSRCAKCRTFYCSREHQKLDWPKHKVFSINISFLVLICHFSHF